MSDRLLGTVRDVDGDEIEVIADADGTVSLEWEHGARMILGRTARDELLELLDRAAMPGQRVNHGPACGCTPCKAEPSYEARRAGSARQFPTLAGLGGEKFADYPDSS